VEEIGPRVSIDAALVYDLGNDFRIGFLDMDQPGSKGGFLNFRENRIRNTAITFLRNYRFWKRMHIPNVD
jgi:hypothetical protein